MQYWLMKSEPTEYSIDDLKRDGRSSWFGVRNYLARNYMRDQMQIGDRVFFYHSSCDIPGIVGIAEVVSSPHTDVTQYDHESKYYDPKTTIENPRWYCIDVGYIAHLDRVLTIRELRNIP
jgi:predicted RNA-binding protein with PUA-like domain